MEQRDQHAQRGTARAQPVGGSADAVMAVDQARHGERHVQRMAHVVIQRVAGEIAGELAGEQRVEIAESLFERGEVGARVAGAEIDTTPHRGRFGSSTLMRLLTSFWLGRFTVVCCVRLLPARTPPER
jgi:hypothetical protein